MSTKSFINAMLGCGTLLLMIELSILTVLLAMAPAAGVAALSMLAACHLGGRLAFIGTGFASGFSPAVVMGIATLHNTIILLLAYSLFLRLSNRLDRVPWLARLQEQVKLRQQLRNRWNLAGIAFLIWVPLPITGVVVGTLLAHLEGYRPHQILPMALSSMIAGVISWTLLFEPLYAWLQGSGPHLAIIFTLILVLLPITYNFLRATDTRPTTT